MEKMLDDILAEDSIGNLEEIDESQLRYLEEGKNESDDEDEDDDEDDDDEDLDEELESFTKRLESMTKCRIDSSNVYTNANKGYYHGHGWIKSCKITLGILALNLSKDRYKL